MANFVTNEYKLDITPQGNYPVVYLSQFENGRQIKFIMMNRGRVFTIPPSGISVTISGVKSNGGYYEHICTFDSRNVYVSIVDDMTDVSGRGVATIKFTDGDGDTVVSAKFVMNVQEATVDSGIEIPTVAETILQQILSEIREEASKLDIDMDELDAKIEGFKTFVNNSYASFTDGINNDFDDFKSDVNNDIGIIDARMDNFLATQAGVSNGIIIQSDVLYEKPTSGGWSSYINLSQDPRNYDYLILTYGAITGYISDFTSYGDRIIKPIDLINATQSNPLGINFSGRLEGSSGDTPNPRSMNQYLIKLYRQSTSTYTQYRAFNCAAWWSGSSSANANGYCDGQDAEAMISRVIGIKFVPAGTDKDAELADIRVGADGVTYTSAGEAVRSQISALNTAIDIVVSSIAELFSTTKVYHTGDHVIYEAGWYTFKADKSAGAWDATKVDGPFKVTEQLSDLKEELSQLVVPTIRYNGFIKGKQIQTYQVGRTITFKADSTNTRAINTTPIYFDRKTFLVAPSGYEAYICHVTAQDNLLVVESTSGYVTTHWVTAQSHIIMQIRRTDRNALSADDMAVINAWIDFRGKKFLDEDVRRMVATKKSYYDGTGTAFGNNHNNFTLAHITDVHADVFRYGNFRQFVDDHADLIDVAICTGDLVDLQNTDQWDAVNGVEGTKEILQVVGNHDRGHQAGDTLLTDEELVAKFGITTNTGMMYYYRDFGDYRVIVLNQFEADVRSEYKYSEDELTWLLSTLDNSITANKHVIIACHIADTFPVSNNIGFYQRYNKWLNKYPPMQSGIEAVIDAFKRGASVSTTVSGISVNHTFSASGDFLCWICGHYHGDYIGYSETYPDQLYLIGNCGACTSPFKGNMGETNSDLTRISGTPTEDCFNVYSFDLANRLVKVAKIGANVNDMMTERKMAVYSI